MNINPYRDLVDAQEKQLVQLGAELEQKHADLLACQADAGKVVHALECATVLIDQLILFIPDGQVMSPGVATAKQNLDQAMAVIFRKAT